MLFILTQNTCHGRHVTHGLSIWDNVTLSEVPEKLVEGFPITSADLLSVFEKRIYLPLIDTGDGETSLSEPPPKVSKQSQFDPDGAIRIAVLFE
jgi:hypothetical protein